MKIKIHRATLKDSPDVYYVRNNENVKKHLFNNISFSFEEHASWFCEKLAQEHDYIYLITTQVTSELVGTLRFDYMKNSKYEISILLLPHYQAQGFGKSSLILGLEKLKNNIGTGFVIAKVMRSNIRSTKLFLSCGFEKIDSNDEYLTYEYKL